MTYIAFNTQDFSMFVHVYIYIDLYDNELRYLYTDSLLFFLVHFFKNLPP